MEAAVLRAREEGDSVGGVVEVVVSRAPAGLGEPVFDKLEADLAKALMSIGAVKGFEVGNGFAASRLRGSENNDPLYAQGTRIRSRTNRAGGISGGISNGEQIVVRIAVKPTSSIRKQQETVATDGTAAVISVEGRHDPCICPRIVPVAEAMVAITLVDHLLRQRALRSGGSLPSLRRDIDTIDRQMLVLLSLRQQLALQIGRLKARRGGRIVDPKRERDVLQNYLETARELGLEEPQVRRMFDAVITMARAAQYVHRRRKRR
jgi:chorismate mutase